MPSHRDKILRHLEELNLKITPEALDQIVIDATAKAESVCEMLERSEIPDALSLFYKVIDARVGRSTAVVTNVDFKDWTEYLGDPQIVMAMLDRLVHRSQVVKFDGKSYRAGERPQESTSAR